MINVEHVSVIVDRSILGGISFHGHDGETKVLLMDLKQNPGRYVHVSLF